MSKGPGSVEEDTDPCDLWIKRTKRTSIRNGTCVKTDYSMFVLGGLPRDFSKTKVLIFFFFLFIPTVTVKREVVQDLYVMDPNVIHKTLALYFSYFYFLFELPLPPCLLICPNNSLIWIRLLGDKSLSNYTLIF